MIKRAMDAAYLIADGKQIDAVEVIMGKTKFCVLFARRRLYYIKCVIMLAFTFYANFKIPVIKSLNLLVKCHVVFVVWMVVSPSWQQVS